MTIFHPNNRNNTQEIGLKMVDPKCMINFYLLRSKEQKWKFEYEKFK